jgi:hypothetical protein
VPKELGFVGYSANSKEGLRSSSLRPEACSEVGRLWGAGTGLSNLGHPGPRATGSTAGEGYSDKRPRNSGR